VAHTVNPALLTSREVCVLCLVSQGLSYDDIGKRLYLSSSTVKFHTASARTKLNACNIAHAIALALSKGLLSVNCPVGQCDCRID
jgi:DNA-binding NarL/FixJ family response regulator